MLWLMSMYGNNVARHSNNCPIALLVVMNSILLHFNVGSLTTLSKKVYLDQNLNTLINKFYMILMYVFSPYNPYMHSIIKPCEIRYGYHLFSHIFV